MSRKTGFVYDPIYKEHVPGAERGGSSHHPESPARCDAVLRGIDAGVPESGLVRLAPRAATIDEICLCHTREYVDVVIEDVSSGETVLCTGDTEICERSYEVALWAAGGVLVAVDEVMAGRIRNAFCAVRPPGHHATADRGMGFCIFNNVAIAARYIQQRHGLERVLVIDWDVHHGNGTQDIFYGDSTVFYFSTHQWPCYPGTGRASETGAGQGKGATLNCPVAAGSGRTELMAALSEKLGPSMREFRPEFVLLSAGFDARHGDPVGALAVRDEDYREMTGFIMDMVDEYAEGRLVSVLEGGYSLSGLAASVGAHVMRLAEGGETRCPCRKSTFGEMLRQAQHDILLGNSNLSRVSRSSFEYLISSFAIR